LERSVLFQLHSIAIPWCMCAVRFDQDIFFAYVAVFLTVSIPPLLADTGLEGRRTISKFFGVCRRCERFDWRRSLATLFALLLLPLLAHDLEFFQLPLSDLLGDIIELTEELVFRNKALEDPDLLVHCVLHGRDDNLVTGCLGRHMCGSRCRRCWRCRSICWL